MFPETVPPSATYSTCSGSKRRALKRTHRKAGGKALAFCFSGVRLCPRYTLKTYPRKLSGGGDFSRLPCGGARKKLSPPGPSLRLRRCSATIGADEAAGPRRRRCRQMVPAPRRMRPRSPPRMYSGRSSGTAATKTLHQMREQKLSTVPAENPVEGALAIALASGRTVYDGRLANAVAVRLPVEWLGGV
jgi:hypothetical protein